MIPKAHILMETLRQTCFLMLLKESVRYTKLKYIIADIMKESMITTAE
jgi:hypothetical protein